MEDLKTGLHAVSIGLFFIGYFGCFLMMAGLIGKQWDLFDKPLDLFHIYKSENYGAYKVYARNRARKFRWAIILVIISFVLFVIGSAN